MIFFIKVKNKHSRLHATNENNMAYKEINMHSKKIAFALVMGLMVTSVWAESNTTTSTSTETTVASADSTSSNSEPQTEVKVEDIDAPVFE